MSETPVPDVVAEAIEGAVVSVRAQRQEDDLSVWIALVDDEFVVVSEAQVHARHDLAQGVLERKSGLLRDSLVLGGVEYVLAMGAGKHGHALVDAAAEALGERGSGELAVRAETQPLARLGSLWFEDPGERLTGLVATLCGPSDRVLGALEGAPPSGPFEDAWLIVTERRAFVLSTRSDGSAPLARDLDEGVAFKQSAVGRDTLSISGEAVLHGPMLAKGAFRELVALALRPAGERMLDAAKAHAREDDWASASELLLLAETELGGLDETVDAEASADAPLALIERVLLRRAQVALALGREDDVVARLSELSSHRPADDLIVASELASPDERWWILLAIAHEESGDQRSAAAVYEKLAMEEGADAAYWLLRARALRAAGAIEDAIEAYERFVAARVKDQDFSAISRAVIRDDEGAGEDPEFAAACLELGALLEQTERPARAARAYLTLVRQAPMSMAGYGPLFALEDALDVRERRILSLVAQMLHMLDPERAASLDGAPAPTAPGELPHAWAVLGANDHDERVVHSGERQTSSLAQRWVGGLVTDARDTADIERHCQRVDARTFPDTARVISDLSAMLGVPTPRVFLSHGLTGVQVLGSGAPMLLLGAAHLDEGHPQFLSLRQRTFALGSQLEHVRAGHLVLTSSEFWDSFRSRSLDGVVTLLTLIPIGGVVGKATDTIAGSLIGKLSKTFENSLSKTLVGYAEKKLAEDGTGAGVQAAYEATLGRMLARTEPEVSEETLLKEQLADFARCAMYTADRVGLLACDSLPDAVEAILRLSSRASAEVDTLERHGLMAILSKRSADGDVVYAELALRVGELLKFALSDDYLALRERLWGEPVSSEEE